MKRSALKSHTLRRATRLMRIVREELILWLGIVITLAVVAAIAVLLFSPLFDVKQITVRRQDARIDVEEIDTTLRPLFHERLFLVTKAQVMNLLHERFPDITEVEIGKDYPSTLIVTVHFDRIVATLDIRDPDGVIASGSGVTTGSGGYAYLTSQGHVVTSAIRLTDTDLPSFTIVDWGIRPVHAMQILDEEFILRIFEARATLEETFGLPVTNVVVYLRGREFHLTVQGISLWFDLATSLQDHINRFRAFLEAVPLTDVKEYIDLRLTDRIVFR